MNSGLNGVDLQHIPSPSFVVDEMRLRANLEIIDSVQKRTGAKVILALKGFAMFSTFSIIREYLCGTTASSVAEALLGTNEFGGEVHTYAPAYTEQDVDELLPISDHITFNSVSQFHRYRDQVRQSPRPVSCGLRVNPEYSEVEVSIYDPCRKFSRLGTTASKLEGADLEGLEGLHFHTMCEQNSDTLERTLEKVVEKFGPLIREMKWINFGGGHHITRPDYDVDRLCRVITAFKNEFDIPVYLEPGEAIALNTGVLVCSVLDIIDNGMPIALLDTSATAHMPDVMEMPYRPIIRGAGASGEKPHTFKLGGLTCLAGDEIGDYSFDEPLKLGDRLVFEDMAHYTMVKTTMFNGVRHPSIGILRKGATQVDTIRTFTYEDYRNRLS